MACDAWYDDERKSYCLGTSGTMVRSARIKGDGSMAFADSNGVVDESVTGIGGVLYVDGTAADGWVWLHADSNGVFSNGLASDNGNCCYLKNGMMQTG